MASLTSDSGVGFVEVSFRNCFNSQFGGTVYYIELELGLGLDLYI